MIDSNVLVAALVGWHQHHAVTASMFDTEQESTFAVAAHSHAEAYTTLTRRDASAPARFEPDEAIVAIDRLCEPMRLLGLTPAQTVEATRDFAREKGIGARLYDRLIGEVAIQFKIPAIITWNVRHFEGLFPTLQILTPEGYAARAS